MRINFIDGEIPKLVFTGINIMGRPYRNEVGFERAVWKFLVRQMFLNPKPKPFSLGRELAVFAAVFAGILAAIDLTAALGIPLLIKMAH